MDSFQRRKEQQLAKNDRSSIGKVDEKIASLCDIINKNEEYYTTSSCSGRIVLIREPLKKQPDLFVFVSHEKVSLEEIWKELEKLKGKGEETIIFKQEPCIMAVACKTIEDASKILDLAREKAGWKNSGIMSLKGRILAELRSTEQLAFPAFENGKMIINEDFLRAAVNEANKRLERSWEKIEKLEKEIKSLK